MALIGAPLHMILRMDSKQLFKYFCDYARYMPDAPKFKYVIQVGSKTLRSDDTMDLRVQFDAKVKKLKEAHARRAALKTRPRKYRVSRL
jgi:hypothetical protein